METVRVKTRGEGLVVNAEASGGSIRVEIVGDDGQVVPGYSAADCVALTTDALDQPVRWKEHSTLPADRSISFAVSDGAG